MQRPDPDSVYYHEFIELQQKLRDKIVKLRKSRQLVQEDMANYELSVRQYQRMEQDPKIVLKATFALKVHTLINSFPVHRGTLMMLRTESRL